MRKILFSFLSLVLIVSSFGPWSVAAAKSAEHIKSLEYVDLDGEKLYLKKEITDEYRKSQVVNEKGEVVAEAVIDLVNDKAILDGVELTDKQFNDLIQLGESALNSDIAQMPVVSSKSASDNITINSTCTNWKQVGSTKYRSTWIPKTGVAAVAAAISIAVPGVGWSIAWAVASVVAGSTNTLYYTVREYSCTKNGTYHLRTTRTFYKNSNYTGYITSFSVYGSRR